MKKSKLLILGLIALMLAGGLVLASCGFNLCHGSCKKGDDTCRASSGLNLKCDANKPGKPDGTECNARECPKGFNN